MKRNYYLFSGGRLSRKDFSLMFENEKERKYIPIEDVEAIYAFAELDLNTKFLNFLSEKNIIIHFFNYYGFYTGSFYPREYLNSGKLIIKQVEHYKFRKKRLFIAKEIINSSVHNILKNLSYYDNRGKDLIDIIEKIKEFKMKIKDCKIISELMGIEGNIREIYYKSFEIILKQDIEFEQRTKQPPKNILNALISFGNSLCYTTVLGEIYRTQLNPLISYLHEPGERRFSLSLDIAEIFKPLLVDRIIFKLINNRMLSENDFDINLNYCYMTEKARKIFCREYDEKLNTIIYHRKLDKNVSYRRLIRLECYKLIKHLIGEVVYDGFKIWW
ncbi:MAG TPA: type I-B CRISPR-associated endonuclease Cas1b [bacterium]|nr:type I-B CRISPR-associated endonuclease Cas1b [bacterium]HOL48900.1 type I-B CRISPR-associated endonuclease Cas1b [bacterium]HPQ20143.1 type I-B CRISPR-associated endonuclease Cas1b [bacterium]